METIKRTINYKSDFDFILKLKALLPNENYEVLSFPNYDFYGYVYTRNKNKYEFSYKNGEMKNVFNDNGDIHIVVNNHELRTGALKVEFCALIPNPLYEDGTKLTVANCDTNIELVDGCGSDFTKEEITLIAPFIKGEKGSPLTYSDMTEEEKDSLIDEVVDDVLSQSITSLDGTNDNKDYQDIF